MAGTIAPFPKHQFFTNAGAVAAGYQLFSYQAGTTTKLATYSDEALTSANTNPIVLDLAGRATIFLSATSYKFVLAPDDDTDPPTSPIWTVDNVTAVPAIAVNLDISGTAGEALSAGDVVYLSAGDGSRTAGRWYKADADNDYSSSTADALGFAVNAISSGSSGSIRLSGLITGLSGLTAGSLYFVSATAGDITSTAPANARAVGVADSATSLVVGQWVVPNVWTLLPEASATVEGIVNLVGQTLGDGKKHFKQVPTFDPGSSDPIGMALQTVGRRASFVDAGGVGNSAGAETVLYSTTIAANALDANLMTIEIEARGTTANTASTDKQLRVRFGPTTLTGTVFGDSGTGLALQDDTWELRAKIIRTAAATQTGDCTMHFSDNGATVTGVKTTFLASGTVNFAATNLLEITGLGTNANDVVLFTAMVKIS